MGRARFGLSQLQSRGLFFIRQGRGASAARVVIQTLGVVIVPACEPGADRLAGHLKDVSELIYGVLPMTEQDRLGAHPHPMSGMRLHHLLECRTLFRTERLNEASWRFHVCHCTEKLLLRYLRPLINNNGGAAIVLDLHLAFLLSNFFGRITFENFS